MMTLWIAVDPENEVVSAGPLEEIYDRVRIVDGEDCRVAVIKVNEYKIEFKEVMLVEGQLEAKVERTKHED